MLGAVFSVYGSVKAVKNYGPEAPKPPLYGLYEVEAFVRNGDTVPPLLTDSWRWKRLIVERKGAAALYMMDGQKYWYDFRSDSLENFVLLNPRKDSSLVDTLYFSEPDSSRFLLEGSFRGNDLKVSFLKKRKEDFLLRSRGFKWVNESPFNR
ncbi:MAG TPA: hypothetical protein ENJ95_04510 [Bacteroidetes bacterium]|nr:hypothetical protein [Bacteroidota bacterium]